MRIGILTWHFAGNYGAVAHTYALRKKIIELGYECEFVNFVPHNAQKVMINSNVNCGNPRKHPLLFARCIIRCLRFTNITKQNVCGDRVYSGDNIDDLRYDAIVIGSDAILNIHHPLFDPIYYGVGISKTPFFTYAPSCEFMKPNENISKTLGDALKKAIRLSARDTMTSCIIEKNTGRKAEVVLDPTLLIDFKSPKKKLVKDDYVLIYSFSPWDEFRSEICEYASKNNFRIISVGRYSKWADISYDMASFEDWLSLFEHASLVITDSFHGTVFAVKNRKRFILFSREDKKYKISEFIDICGLDNMSFYNGEGIENYIEKNEIDYDLVFDRIDKYRIKSMEYLIDGLHEIESLKNWSEIGC